MSAKVDRARVLRKERKMNGLCACGKTPAPGLKTCQRCLDSHANSQRVRSFQNYWDRKEIGLCVEAGCEGEPVPGLVRCGYHLELAQERRERIRAKKKAQLDLPEVAA